ncbi:MAG: hypothetical protein HY706_10565 [Candidatus Hydrogenedentes bacterium]|nr:hypothetical protein [Candidatus Hydrogenedentota bacterium]
MNVYLAIAEDRAVGESLRAALPENDLVLIESSVESALRRLISIKPDVIILDDSAIPSTPAMDRVRGAAGDVPLLALSSHGDAETLAGYTLAGVQACLAKPFSCEALRAEVQRLAFVDEPALVPTAGTSHLPEWSGALSRHQTAVRWLSRVASHIKDPFRLSQSLLDSVVDIFDVARGAVLLESNGGVRVVASQGLPPNLAESLRFGFATGLMRWFESNVRLIDRLQTRDAAGAVKEMSLLGARLGAPILCSGRVHGAVLVGEKSSGLEYGPEERDLLSMVARCASIAFENAKLYQDASRQRARLDALLATITAGVVVVRPDKTVSLLNQGAERALQVRAGDVLGRSVQKLGSAFADVVLHTLADGKPRLRQEIFDRAIDARLGLSVTPMGSEGVVVIFSRLPDESARTEDIAYSPFWEYLASRVAQEIKNPMVAINTFAQLLPRKYDSTDFREAFGEVVQKEISRINLVVETLFEFARHPRLVLQRTNVNDTLQNVLRTFEDKLRAHSIRLETSLDPSVSEAELDPIFFSQAIHNVVQNSLEAMPEGGTLSIRTRQTGDSCEILIADSGPGIAEKDAPHVFKPFFSTKEQGMGLGLTVASRIMRQHKGELRLVSNPEGGSAFAFHLPISGQMHADHPGS